MLPAPLHRDTFYVPRILRLQAEIGGMFADSMDLLSLTRWRLTCRTNYEQAAASLRRSLMTMLTPFASSPIVILDLITNHRAVFGGLFALAFVLRDRSIMLNGLDIYVSDHEFGPFCSSLLGNCRIQNDITTHEYSDLTVLDALRTLVSRVLTIHTSRGNTIRIHRSYTSSATAPISRASCTALSNFVTAYSFGCSHPVLTLNRRALITDQELPVIPIPDHELHDKLMSHDFSLGFSPTVWPEFRRYVPPRIRRKSRKEASDITDGSDAHEAVDCAAGSDNAAHSVPDFRDTSVGQSAGAVGDDPGTLLTVYMHHACHVDGASGCLTCFPIDPVAADVLHVTPDLNELGPGELILNFEPSALDASEHTLGNMPLSGSNTSLDKDACPGTEPEGPWSSIVGPTAPSNYASDSYAPLSGTAGFSITEATFLADSDATLDSIYSLGVDSLLDVQACSPPSPMSRLLAVLDSSDRPRFEHPIYDNASLRPDGEVVQAGMSTLFPQAVSERGQDIFHYDNPCSLYHSHPIHTETVDPTQLVGCKQLQSTGTHAYTTTPVSNASIDIVPGPDAEWSLDLRRYTYVEPTESHPQHAPPVVEYNNDVVEYFGPSPHNDVSDVVYGTHPHAYSHHPESSREGHYDPRFFYNDENLTSETGLHEVESPSHVALLAQAHPLHTTSACLQSDDDPRPHTATQTDVTVPPYHDQRNCPSASPTAVTLDSDGIYRRDYEGLIHDTPYLQDVCVVGPPHPAPAQTSAVVIDSCLATAQTCLDNDNLPEEEERGGEATGEADSLGYDVSLVSQGTVAVDEHGAPPSFVGSSGMDIHRGSTSDAEDEPESDGDESEDYSDSAATDVYPPRPVECLRHRFICPSQGRYFGDRGSFVDFFDPLRGAELYCAQNNIAPFGPMVVWRVLSTFNCEEGCDMYDDVLDEGVTSIPVLIRRDPFGGLRDTITDRPMVGFHRHRSLSPY